MTWEEIALDIGDDAKAIIEQDRGESMNGGKIVCFMTEHKSDPLLSWLPTKAGDAGKYKCCNCGEVYGISDHVKWLAHDDNKHAYELLCEFAGVDTANEAKKPVASLKTPTIAKSEPVEDVQIFPKVEAVTKKLAGNAKHYLTGRGISHETLIDYKVTSDDNAIYFNYLASGKLVKVKGRAIGDMDNGKNKYAYTPKGGTNVVYGQHMHSSQRTIAICEGEIDALSLHESLKANGWADVILASSIPSGSSSTSWIKNSISFLKKFEAVILVPDNDDAGKKFISKAGSELMMLVKVRTCTLENTDSNDINELLQKEGGRAVCSVIASSNEYMPDFADDLSNLPETNEIGYSKSGFYTLDKMLRGFGWGLLTLFTGHSGDGKTTIIRQILSYNVSAKSRTGVLMGEEDGNTLRDMLLYQTFKKSKPDSFDVYSDEWSNVYHKPKAELVELFNNEFHPYISSFSCKNLQTSERMTKIYEWVKFEAAIYGTRLFIIDNLMKLEVGTGDNIYSAQGDIIDTLKNICHILNVHIIIVAHPKKEESQIIKANSVSGSKKLVNTVDNLVIFQRLDRIDDSVASKIRERLSENGIFDQITAFFKVDKNRRWGKLGHVPLRYSQESNTIHDLDPENQYRYGFTIPSRLIEPEEERY